MGKTPEGCSPKIWLRANCVQRANPLEKKKQIPQSTLKEASCGIFHHLSLMPKNNLKRPANIFGLLTTTTFIARSFQHRKRKIPKMISKAAMTNSITFREKNEMHITAPRNAARASQTPALEQFCRLGFLRRNILFTSLSLRVLALSENAEALSSA